MTDDGADLFHVLKDLTRLLRHDASVTASLEETRRREEGRKLNEYI